MFIDLHLQAHQCLRLRNFSYAYSLYVGRYSHFAPDNVFIVLLVRFGNVWAVLLPQRHVFETRGWVRAAKAAHFINPGAFGLKEVSQSVGGMPKTIKIDPSFQHVVATIIASTASGGSSAVNNFAVQKANAFPI
jgi:hypothetical protein